MTPLHLNYGHRKSLNRSGGFIALTSAIIISAILLLVATTGGLTGIFARGDALDGELKLRSSSAADACADQALLALAGSPTYPGGSVYTLNSLDECRVGAVSTISIGPSSYYAFRVQATSSRAAITNLEVVASTTDLSIYSWREIPRF